MQGLLSTLLRPAVEPCLSSSCFVAALAPSQQSNSAPPTSAVGPKSHFSPELDPGHESRPHCQSGCRFNTLSSPPGTSTNGSYPSCPLRNTNRPSIVVHGSIYSIMPLACPCLLSSFSASLHALATAPCPPHACLLFVPVRRRCPGKPQAPNLAAQMRSLQRD